MIILGIETSCDETAVSIVEGKGKQIKILSNIVSSQIDIHKKYGGVVPEVAARHHIINILPVLNEALEQAGISRDQASKEIKAIAVVAGPGLITSLMIGLETAKTLAYVWNLPIVPINHIEGHIYANFINNDQIKFPSMTLTVSGGHTMLVLMKKHLQYQTIGNTLDDAAGEAFDKAAKLMDLGYPGGPIVSTQAEKYQGKKNKAFDKSQTKNSKVQEIVFPRPMLNKPNFNFSFSGIKTALLYQIQKDKDWSKKIPEYCYEYQQAIIDSLIGKTIKASEKYKVKTIMLAGGVSANKKLRADFQTRVATKLPKAKLMIPDLKYTTDNAAMIATAGYFKYKYGKKIDWSKLKVDPNLNL